MAQKIEIAAAVWSDEAARVLAATGDIEDYRIQCEQGAQLFEVTSEGGRVGFYMLRVDKTAQGHEGVLVAGAGSLQGADLVETLIPFIEKQFIGCYAMRVHTERVGLAKKLAKQGYGAMEIVLRKQLNGR